MADKDIAALQRDIDGVRKWFVDEKTSVHKSLDATLKRFGDIDKRFDDIDKRLDDLNKRLDQVTQTLVQVAVKTRPK